MKEDKYKIINVFMKQKSILLNVVKSFSFLVALFLIKHFDSEFFIFPLFSLCGCNSSGEGCSNGSSSGDGLGGSTPFLCTWNGKKFQFENDILFGKPESSFPTKESGLSAYESGNVIGDCYRINNPMVPKDDLIAFQIKEIEPEESFIDYLSLLHVTYPKNGQLIMGSDFKSILVFDKTSLQKKEGIQNENIKDQNGVDISRRFEVFDNAKRDTSVYAMESQDAIQINAKVEDRNNPLYLIVGSHYRDWTLGKIIMNGDTSVVKNNIKNVFFESHSVQSFIAGTIKVSALTLLLVVMWASGFIQSIFSFHNNTEKFAEVNALAKNFGIQSVRADLPADLGNNKSLIVEYFDGSTYHRVDVIQPRCYQKTLEAVLIPQEAIQSSGEVSIRITATKKHDVTDLFFIAPKKLLPFEMMTLGVTKAFHQREKRDYAQVLNEKNSKEYLHTIPSDIVDIEFGPISREKKGRDQNEAFLIQAHGFYTPATEESQKIAGDWVSKLDPEARQILSKMYTLEDYGKKDRATIL